MSLKEELDAAMKNAMRAKDAASLSCIRMVVSAIRNKELEKRSPLTDAEIISVLQTLAKQRQESIDMFAKGGRTDLADKESAELDLIRSYLPKQLSDEELSALVEEAAKEMQASSAADMGRVMKALQPKVAGRADGRRVSDAVKKKLSGA